MIVRIGTNQTFWTSNDDASSETVREFQVSIAEGQTQRGVVEEGQWKHLSGAADIPRKKYLQNLLSFKLTQGQTQPRCHHCTVKEHLTPFASAKMFCFFKAFLNIQASQKYVPVRYRFLSVGSCAKHCSFQNWRLYKHTIHKARTQMIILFLVGKKHFPFKGFQAWDRGRVCCRNMLESAGSGLIPMESLRFNSAFPAVGFRTTSYAPVAIPWCNVGRPEGEWNGKLFAKLLWALHLWRESPNPFQQLDLEGNFNVLKCGSFYLIFIKNQGQMNQQYEKNTSRKPFWKCLFLNINL